LKTQKNTAVTLLVLISFFILTGLTGKHQKSSIPESSLYLAPISKIAGLQEKVKYLYVGMEKCASVCHNNKDMGFQYDIVKNSPHANAYNILLSEKALRFAKKADLKGSPDQSPVCLSCHVTAAGLDSSFLTSTYKKEDGVTCEACHKGAYITRTFIPSEADCLKCHNDSVHKTRVFNFKVNCEKIAHKRPVAKSATL
jgi:hypothetical protein